MVVDYGNGKVYKICSFQTDKIYVGSTTQQLCNRIAKHKINKKNYENGKYNYVTSYDILKYDDAKIILMENYPCNTKTELEARERYYIENNNCVNKYIPVRAKGEADKVYYEKNKDERNRKRAEDRKNNPEKWAEYDSNQWKKHKDKINERRNEKFTCECGLECTKRNKLRHIKTKKHLDKINIK